MNRVKSKVIKIDSLISASAEGQFAVCSKKRRISEQYRLRETRTKIIRIDLTG